MLGVDDWSLVVFRWMHILAAITAVGATIFMRQALVPAADSLPESSRSTFHEAVRSKWAMYVHMSIGFLLLSGFYSFIMTLRGNVFPEGSKYHMLFGIKFLLALAIFFIASMLVGRSEASAKFRQKREFWLTVNVVLAVVLVCISGILRFLPREPKGGAPVPAAAAAQVERNALRITVAPIRLERIESPLAESATL